MPLEMLDQKTLRTYLLGLVDKLDELGRRL